MSRVSLEARFWRKVRKGPTCWLWDGCQNQNGYGQMRWVDGRIRKAHHISLMLVGRTPLPGLDVSHICHERSCVRPSHLKVSTHAENMRDGTRPRRGKRRVNGTPRKLTAKQVLEIRARVASGESQRSVARAFGLASSFVSYVVRGRSWAHLPSEGVAA